MLKISHTTRQIILLALGVLLVRILYVDIYSQLQKDLDISLSDAIRNLVDDYLSLAIMIMLTAIYATKIGKHFPYGKYPAKRSLLIFIFIILISIVITIIVNRDNFFSGADLSHSKLFLSFLAAVLVNTIIMILIDVIRYFYMSKLELETEKVKKHKAQYQYTQLKQQLNPHFLINCLSLLDYLVQINETERASTFIKKLANVYRYLLANEGHKVVSVEEEIKFVNSYSSLLSERFEDGMEISVDVDEENRKKMIIPCGLQILIENATKHNIVNKIQPLKIKIFIENGSIVVLNNLQPRLSQISMGIGLKNLSKQYKDISDKEIKIEKTETEFKVYLPLINKNDIENKYR